MKNPERFGLIWPFPPTAEPGEKWRRCQSWPRIWASSEGRIARQNRLWTPPRIRKIALSQRDGRPLSGTRLDASRHVADAFHGPKPEGFEVCHRDGDPTNNRPENLRYGTHRENWQDAVEHGTMPPPILSDDDAGDILSLMILGQGDADTARRFGIGRSLVHHIRNGRAWRHVAPELPRRAAWRAMQQAQRESEKARPTRRHSMQRPRQSPAAAQ